MSYLGLDIGGANLKASSTCGWACSLAFPLWKDANRLAAQLSSLISAAPRGDAIAVTMTGELADCFRTKAEGVRFICQAAKEAAGSRPLYVYTVNGRFISPSAALDAPLAAAASNWHALANYLARLLRVERGLLIDLGSTTCDIIPIASGEPQTTGTTDIERLIAGELVYTGAIRTPVCAVTRQLPYRGAICPTASELFATVADAYLILGDLPEEPADCDTADGRPATRPFAEERLARMVCADREQFDGSDAMAAARFIKDIQLSAINGALASVVRRMDAPPDTVFFSGQGEFLLRELKQREPLARIAPPARVLSLAALWGTELSRVAPAHAVARLAEVLL